MMKIALLSTDTECRASYLQGRLPERYMEDFSLAGLVVDRYTEAYELLRENGYRLKEQAGGAEIALDLYQHLPEVMSLLAANHINCELWDIADTIYQA